MTSTAVSEFRGIDGIQVVGKQNIPLDAIILDLENNKARTSGTDQSLVNLLRENIEANGILSYLPKPVVEVLSMELRQRYNVKPHQKYLLLDGHHRFKALQALGYKEMFCDVVECDSEWSRRAFQVKANIHPPSKGSSVIDFQNYLSQRIEAGDIENNQSAIISELNKVAKGLNKKMRDQIVAETIKSNGAEIQWLNYSRKDASDWLDDFDLFEGGDFNEITERFGAVMTADSEWRIIERAIKNYNSLAPNGKRYVPTDIVIKVFHKGDDDVMDKRRAVRDRANEILLNMLEACGVEEFPHGWPIRFIGYLPQDIGGGEDAHTFYEIDPDDELIDGA